MWGHVDVWQGRGTHERKKLVCEEKERMAKTTTMSHVICTLVTNATTHR
jgi:hypothetical protein